MSRDSVALLVVLLIAAYLVLTFWRQLVITVVVGLLAVFVYGAADVATLLSRR